MTSCTPPPKPADRRDPGLTDVADGRSTLLRSVQLNREAPPEKAHRPAAVQTNARVVVASPGGWSHVSTKYRLGPIEQEIPGILRVVSVDGFPTTAQIDTLESAAGSHEALLLQRVMPDPAGMARLRAAYERVYFDFDDAIYAVPPDLRGSRIASAAKAIARVGVRGYPYAAKRRRPLARTLAQVDVCVVGNSILGEFARRYANTVVEIPTTVDVPEKPATDPPDSPVIAWMGVRPNLQFLELVRRPLRQLARERDITLRIISRARWEDESIPIEFVHFSDEAAEDALLTSTLGISPLPDTPHTRGKCAMRAIQFGAHGLPCVASPVGITDRIVVDGETGLLASSADQWLHALCELLADHGRAAEMGRRAHARIQRLYSNPTAAGMWREALRL